LTWNYAGDFDLTVDASNGYYFYKDRDIMNAPGGENV
jgi:hypothetical protein